MSFSHGETRKRRNKKGQTPPLSSKTNTTLKFSLFGVSFLRKKSLCRKKSAFSRGKNSLLLRKIFQRCEFSAQKPHKKGDRPLLCPSPSAKRPFAPHRSPAAPSDSLSPHPSRRLFAAHSHLIINHGNIV